MVNPFSPTPAYVQVADEIEARIKAGKLRPLMPIPSEKAMVAEFGCSRGTARSAVALLRRRNLVITIQGRGTYVAERPTK